MPLPSDYADGNCSASRALEVIGERWTLLIIRDAFYGVRRFTDFITQLGIPRAVLSTRLKTLVAEGILTREAGPDSSVEYELTAKGLAAWPVLRSLMSWGDDFYSPAGPKRLFRHDADAGLIDDDGRCRSCGKKIDVSEMRIERGPGFDTSKVGADSVSSAIDVSRRLLEPIRT